MEAAPLQGKTELLEKMAERAEQEQQNQQKIAEAEQLEKALQVSQIEQNTSLAEERRARVLSDIGLAKERMSEVTQNEAKALLDNAKTLAEIEDIPRKRLMDVMQLAAEMRMKEDDRINKQLKQDAQMVK
jgi:hypothetical protein